MIKDIVKDIIFLGKPSEPATENDVDVITDLKDTLNANRQGCVGMAGNMIGMRKRIIIVTDDKTDIIMINPVIIKKSGEYQTEEGCLSLEGVRKTKRYKTIKVEYQNEQFKKRIKTFNGFTAQIIQHEIDHINGIII